MVEPEIIEKQIKNIGFNPHGWGRTEIRELHNIILPDEKIFECVNGIYEGGFALLLATDVRVLLIDKKPLNYLTVEDLRFDMINEIDYNHRLIGAYISISAGNKNLKFTSVNQPRLRRLIGHVQRCMAEIKKKQSDHQEGQNLHLERLNQQLQAYLLAQNQQQHNLQQQLQQAHGNGQPSNVPQPAAVRPAPELSDYLYAQSLLAQHQARTGQPVGPIAMSSDQSAEIYSAAVREVFGVQPSVQAVSDPTSTNTGASHILPRPHPAQTLSHAISSVHHSLEVNPLKVAYAKLPLILRSRKLWSSATSRPD